MKKNTGLLPVLMAAFLITLTIGACASKEKKAEGPAAGGAVKQAATSSGGNMAKPETPSGGIQTAAVSESTPTAEELAARERERKAELERQKQAEAERAAAAFKAAELEKVYYDYDKFNIKPEFRDALAKDAEALKKNPNATAVIEGHCDERGTTEYNLALGERRAASAKKYLVSLGVDNSRLKTVSYGKEKSADPGHNEAAWSKNRRAQFSNE